MRTIKDPAERKTEILDCAENLFTTKGYMQTTINDVLNELSIAKGTFYHYFKSKEQLMEAVVMRFVAQGAASAKAVADDPKLTAVEKMRKIIVGTAPDNKHKDLAIEQMHQAGSAEMHQKSLVETVRQCSPILAEIVQQGIKEGSFTTEHPYETVEFLLAGSEFWLDEGIFHWSEKELMIRAKVFSKILETLLQAQPGTFDFIYTRFEEIIRNKQIAENE